MIGVGCIGLSIEVARFLFWYTVKINPGCLDLNKG